MLPYDSAMFKRMADDVGVSANMLFIQLKKHKMIDYRPIDEYIELVGLEGEKYCL